MHSLFVYFLVPHVKHVRPLWPWHVAIRARSTQDMLALSFGIFLSCLYTPRSPALKESYPPFTPWFLLINHTAVMKAGTPEGQRWKVQMLLIHKSIFCSDISPGSTSGQQTVCFIFSPGVLLECQYKLSKMKLTTLPIKYALFCISCPDECHHHLPIHTSETWKS